MPNRKAVPQINHEAALKIIDGKIALLYRPKQVIFSQGDRSDAVFYIQKGNVRLTIVSKRGKEAIVGVLGEGAFFGEQCMADEPLRIMTAATTEPCSIIQIGKMRMRHLLCFDLEISQRFISHLLLRNKHVYEDLVDRLFNNSEKRLVRLLLSLAMREENGNGEAAIPKINQEDLAEMVGTTRGRVNFFMNKFKKLGLIDYNGQLVVHRTLLNSVIIDD